MSSVPESMRTPDCADKDCTLPQHGDDTAHVPPHPDDREWPPSDIETKEQTNG